jgi:amino acid transporter
VTSTILTYLSQAIVYVVMNVLAEMVTFLPMSGITVPYFVGRFVDRSLAFATGWNYWYAYAILVAAEATAGSIILRLVGSKWQVYEQSAKFPRIYHQLLGE